jgi:hypothetical protein
VPKFKNFLMFKNTEFRIGDKNMTKSKVTLMLEPLCQFKAFSGNEFGDNHPKNLHLKSSFNLFLHLLSPKLSFYLAYFVFATIPFSNQPSFGAVYYNCKAIAQINEPCDKNFIESTYSSENTEDFVSSPDLIIESTNFNFPPQNQKLNESNEQITDYSENDLIINNFDEELSHNSSDYIEEQKDSFLNISPQLSENSAEVNWIDFQAETEINFVKIEQEKSLNLPVESFDEIDWQDIHQQQNHLSNNTENIEEDNFNIAEKETHQEITKEFISYDDPYPVDNIKEDLSQYLAQEELEDNNTSNTNSSGDPELGTLLLQEIKPNTSRREENPLFYLIGNFGYMRSNNIFSGINPVDDNLFRTGVTFLTLPSLSKDTSLIGSVGLNFISYQDQTRLDYDQLNLNLGVIHNFNDNLSGQMGWKNRQLFDGNNGDRFLKDHSFYVGIDHQREISQNLFLNAGYELQTNFSDPDSRSQIINSLNVGLDYKINPVLKAGFNYQLALSNFTQQDRDDTYHQLMGTLRYSISKNASAEMFLGQSFGHSSNQNINYDGLIFGVGMNFYLF